ncbi:CHASE domain-containing protein [Xinfangfangia sp. CPCC 101601]|uniref:histidine kinase n=1 Tax=Pseudogemmobacter lacusdianii TaxID=3069608 RepID=A0ABU0W1H2_9RHOB|nr:CHASE domain-containing protein [Xinfangfangia sp. CPCC 101601]MDQ2067814.1 CHASE domain-containing protein [Xinfangfangia sp. CPCC 101601]
MKAFLGRRLPFVATVAAALVGIGMTSAVYVAEVRRAEIEFNRAADLSVEMIMTRLREHLVLIKAAKGLFASERGMLGREKFLVFLSSVGLDQELAGVLGIGVARLDHVEDTSNVEAQIQSLYGAPIKAYPMTDQDLRATIVLLEPVERGNLGAIGYDMYSNPVRRAAIDRAILTGEAEMSGPVRLIQEASGGQNYGFLIFLAYSGIITDARQDRTAQAMVYAPFRGEDLVDAAMGEASNLPVALRITDTEYPNMPLFSSEAQPTVGGLHVSREVAVMGRQWQFDIAQTLPTHWQRHIGSVLVGLISLLFAAATGFAIAARQHEAEQAREVASAASREVEYRSLLLQEMKHRIKNHIARIQSIARQSARGATDVKAFTESFDARLQAMAAVQEFLAGTAMPQAELTAILRKELQQCLDTDEVAHLIDGPAVYLDERQAHAFALVVHELVTNALKYGGLSGGHQNLNVKWQVLPKTVEGAAPRDGAAAGAVGAELVMDWIEHFPVSDEKLQAGLGGKGFGSRLIEVSLKSELSGSITRELASDGLRIALRFPLNPGQRPNRSPDRAGAHNVGRPLARPSGRGTEAQGPLPS